MTNTNQITLTINKEEAELILTRLDRYLCHLADLCAQYEFKHEKANARYDMVLETMNKIEKQLGK